MYKYKIILKNKNNQTNVYYESDLSVDELREYLNKHPRIDVANISINTRAWDSFDIELEV